MIPVKWYDIISLVKPPLVNQQSLVYQFKCDLCDAGYVSFTRRHLHQRVDEHRHTSSSISKHFRDKHSLTSKDLTTNFTILKKCNSKFDCLIYEMFFLNEVLTYNVIQLVRKFLNSFPFILFLYALIVLIPVFYIFMLLHLSLHFFVLLLLVLMEIFIFTLLDNDRWMVEMLLSHPDSFYYNHIHT